MHTCTDSKDLIFKYISTKKSKIYKILVASTSENELKVKNVKYFETFLYFDEEYERTICADKFKK